MSPAELELYAALSRAMHEAHVVGGLSAGATVAVALVMVADVSAAECSLDATAAAAMSEAAAEAMRTIARGR